MKLGKKEINSLYVVGKNIFSIEGTYISFRGPIGFYKNDAKGITVECTIKRLEELDNFTCSYTIDKVVNKELGSLCNGSNPIDLTHDSDAGVYIFSNGSKKVAVRHFDVDFKIPLIDEITASATCLNVSTSVMIKTEDGWQRNISTRGELGMTGKEKSVRLVIRDEVLTGVIIDGSSEHYFDPDTREGLENHPPTILRSNYFLKIGKENYKLTIYKKEQQFWLLTEVKPGLGIQCRMLERLTSL